MQRSGTSWYIVLPMTHAVQQYKVYLWAVHHLPAVDAPSVLVHKRFAVHSLRKGLAGPPEALPARRVVQYKCVADKCVAGPPEALHARRV